MQHGASLLQFYKGSLMRAVQDLFPETGIVSVQKTFKVPK